MTLRNLRSEYKTHWIDSSEQVVFFYRSFHPCGFAYSVSTNFLCARWCFSHCRVFQFTKLSILRRFCGDSSAMVRSPPLPAGFPPSVELTWSPPPRLLYNLILPAGNLSTLSLVVGRGSLIKDPRRGPRQENKPRPSLSPSFCCTIMIRAVCSPSDLHGSGARCERALQCWRRGFVTVSRVFGVVCLFVLTSKMAFFLENGICVILASLADRCSSLGAISSGKWPNVTFRWTTMTGQFYIFSCSAFFSLSLWHSISVWMFWFELQMFGDLICSHASFFSCKKGSIWFSKLELI